MQLRLIRESLIVPLTLLAICSSSFAQKPKTQPPPLSEAEVKKLEKTRLRPPSGASFYLGPIEGAHPRFSMLLTDSNQAFVEETYTVRQLAIIEAVLIEAKKFAHTAEAVGTTTPIVTRFSDKQEPSFMVDVEKMGDKSRFYVTIKAISGRKLTVDTGAVKRGDKEATGLFFTILERIEAARAEAG
jgi:hypothetical protein